MILYNSILGCLPISLPQCAPCFYVLCPMSSLFLNFIEESSHMEFSLSISLCAYLNFCVTAPVIVPYVSFIM